MKGLEVRSKVKMPLCGKGASGAPAIFSQSTKLLQEPRKAASIRLKLSMDMLTSKCASGEAKL